MDVNATQDNKRSVNLYTLVWLGCKASCETCVLSTGSDLTRSYFCANFINKVSPSDFGRWFSTRDLAVAKF